MSQSASDALLPPMEHEEFQATFSYCLLMEHEEYRREVCVFLNIAGVDKLAFVANPYYGFYGRYGQEDFDEILAYVWQYGRGKGKPAADGFYRYFQPVETPVGKFILCNHVDGGIIGILSK